MREFGLLGIFFLVGAVSTQAAEPETPKHLTTAVAFVQNLKLSDTGYNHGEPRVEWSGTNRSSAGSSHTDCSGFIDSLFAHCYGYERDDFKKWFGKNRPTANNYHDAIVDEKGFKQIALFKDVKPGDILAVKFFVKKSDTGHVMLAAGLPQKITAKAPLKDGTDQWEIAVIDSSKSGHGPTDTRHKKGDDGKDHDGLGQGVLRVYTNADGSIAGWTWSSSTVSVFKDPKEEHLVVGRLKPGFKP